ncbi:MAG: heme-copper oxidase subunit III [Sphingobacteriales bacterium]|jgi:cytochrome c oxidase subunit 3|nr:MAG: heme-copper oxidase subunit III [Sphingobacteriales bacterium]
MSLTLKYQEKNQGAHKFTMWLFIVSSCMVFAGFTSAFLVRKGAGGAWTGFSLPNEFNISTFIILFSSICLLVADISNKKGNKILMSFTLLLTIICGVLFCYFQYNGWMILSNQGFYPAGNPNPAPQFLFVIVLMHALHVLTGLVFLTVAFVRSLIALRKIKSDEVLEKIELSEKGVLSIRTDLLSLFWHFMGILWLYLFGFLYFNL